MIIEMLLQTVQNFFVGLFDILPDIPALPTSITDSIDIFLDLIFSNVGVLGVFIDINLLKVLVPLLIIIINFEHIYRFIKWVLRKIPFLNIS